MYVYCSAVLNNATHTHAYGMCVYLPNGKMYMLRMRTHVCVRMWSHSIRMASENTNSPVFGTCSKILEILENDITLRRTNYETNDPTQFM